MSLFTLDFTLAPDGVPAQLLWHAGTYRLLTSEAILAELANVLHYNGLQRRYKLNETLIQTYLVALRADSEAIEIFDSVQGIS